MNAYSAVENAQRRLHQAEQRAAANPSVVTSNSLANAQAALAQANMQQASRFAGYVVGGITAVISAVHKAIDAYSDWGREVMNIKDLTGSSAREAAQAASLFQVAGIKDAAALRDLLKLNHANFTSQGGGALSALGISPNSARTGLALFNQIADKLGSVQSATKRTEIMTELFGTRGVATLLPLLRLTHEQRDAVLQLSEANEQSFGTLQRFQFASALLGETIQQKLIFPILEKLLPTILSVIDVILSLINVFAEVNKATGGFLGVALAMGAIGVAVIGTVAAFSQLAQAIKLASMWQAVLDALEDNFVGLAAGTAIAAAVGVSLYAADQAAHPTRTDTAPMDANTQALQQNTMALDRMADNFPDNFSKFNLGGVPSDLNKYDIQQIARMRALGAIG